MLRILVIDEGSPGHLSQSRGLAQALAARMDGEVVVHSVRFTLCGFFRPWLKLITRFSRRAVPGWILRLAYDGAEKFDDIQAHIIVTSGGRGLYMATALSRKLGAPLVFCGDPAPLPAAWCDVILSPLPIRDHARVIQTELLVTEMTPGGVAGRGDFYRKACVAAGGERVGVLLVGGDSRSHRYSDEDWAALAAGINRLGTQGWRWLISTSRRTPRAAERLLRERIDPSIVLTAVWWHQRQERVMLDYLGAADALFVTQDSLSMLSEAIAAGKPTFSLVPDETHPSTFIETVIARQEKARRLRRVRIADLQKTTPDPGSFELLQENLLEKYAAQTEHMLADWTRHPS